MKIRKLLPNKICNPKKKMKFINKMTNRHKIMKYSSKPYKIMK